MPICNGVYETTKHLDHRSDHTTTSTVYFLGVVRPGDETGAIKIGYASKYKRRLDEHKYDGLGYEREIHELCVVRAAREQEASLHKYFAKHQLAGRQKELFAAHDDVLDYVRWLRDQYFAWTPDCSQCQQIERMPIADKDWWLPNEDRRKPRPKKRGLFDDDFGPFCMPPRELTDDDFYTDSAIIERARLAMGGIDLDPATHAIANEKVRASRIFTFHDDGLRQQWAGRVWCNPPFSKWDDWVPKILREYDSGRCEAICALTANRKLSAQFMAPIHKRCDACCITDGRIPFWGGKATSSPDDGHTIFYFGKQPDEFCKAFSDISHVYKRFQ